MGSKITITIEAPAGAGTTIAEVLCRSPLARLGADIKSGSADNTLNDVSEYALGVAFSEVVRSGALVEINVKQPPRCPAPTKLETGDPVLDLTDDCDPELEG